MAALTATMIAFDASMLRSEHLTIFLDQDQSSAEAQEALTSQTSSPLWAFLPMMGFSDLGLRRLFRSGNQPTTLRLTGSSVLLLGQ
jgi:hypothetical protein